MSYDECLICEDIRESKSKVEEIARKRASRTAHQLASDQADVGFAGLEWLEVYGIFFPKIFKHEYDRNLKFERELEQERIVKWHQDHPGICGYHSESVGWLHDGFHAKCMKELRREYATSKWPNKK